MKLKIIIIVCLLFSQVLSAKPVRNKHYIDSSELELKIFASQMFYFLQMNITDTSFSQKGTDYYLREYFERSNYHFEAVQIIMDFAEKEAHNMYYTEERGQCMCYKASIDFLLSTKLRRKIRSLRKYLY